jgi:single-strand DNA-binding protein
MARGVNKVILIGNLGKDPEIRSTPSGVMVASFSLATADRQKDAQGNWQDHTEWHNLKAFNRTAEVVRDYVKKGSKLYIEGKITTNSTEILVNELIMLDSRAEGSGGAGGYSRQAGSSSSADSFDQRPSASQEEVAQSTQISDDDIPF